MKEKVKVNNLDKFYLSKLEDASFYKLDCCTYKQDLNQIYHSTFNATVRGFSAIDIHFDETIINYSIKAINDALATIKELNNKKIIKPLVFSSLSSSSLNKLLKLANNKINLLMSNNIDVIEIHIDQPTYSLLHDQIYFLNKYFPNKIISINLSRKKFSNLGIVELIKLSKEISNNLILELDGSNNQYFKYSNYKNTLETISIADMINKELRFKESKFRNLPILLSGGTNKLTSKFAKQCGVYFNGITFKLQSLTNDLLDTYNLNNYNKIIENI